MATYSSVLAWRIPGTGEPGGLPSLGLHRVGHDWSDLAAAAAVSCCQREEETCHSVGTFCHFPSIFGVLMCDSSDTVCQALWWAGVLAQMASPGPSAVWGAAKDLARQVGALRASSLSSLTALMPLSPTPCPHVNLGDLRGCWYEHVGGKS